MCTEHSVPVQYCYQCGSQSIRQISEVRLECAMASACIVRCIYTATSLYGACTCSEDGMDHSVADPLGSRIPLHTGTNACRIAEGIIPSTEYRWDCLLAILPSINYNTIVDYAQVYACHTSYSVLLHQFVPCNYA